MKILLRFLFKILYHQLAFAYDLIAAMVSFGRWKDWVSSILPFISGTRVLEIGFGPGHLQRLLLDRNLVAVGIDESAPMIRLAQRNLARDMVNIQNNRHTNATDSSSLQSPHQSAYTQGSLARGLAQQLPFHNQTFDSVVATFPAEYIFNPSALTEAHRVLTENGRFVILPGAIIKGRRLWDRFMAWVFRITGQVPPNLIEVLYKKSKEPFAEAGFQLEIRELEIKSSTVYILIATKSSSIQMDISDEKETSQINSEIG